MKRSLVYYCMYICMRIKGVRHRVQYMAVAAKRHVLRLTYSAPLLYTFVCVCVRVVYACVKGC